MRSSRPIIRSWLACASGAVALAALPARAIESVSELSTVLERHAIPFDASTARRAAIQGMLRTVDPSARVMTRDEAARLADSLACRDGGTNAPAGSSNGCSVAVSESWQEGIGYLKLRGLYPDAGERVASQLRAWSATNGLGGAILDVRAASGADLASVDAIASLFEGPDEVLFRVRNGYGEDVDVHRRRGGGYLSIPLMLLVDTQTAGAAEVLAAVMSGRRGVMLIGASTRGDHGLREIIPLDDELAMYVASRHVALPDGSTYDMGGVDPDIRVAPAKGATATGAVASAAAPTDAKGRALPQRDPKLAERMAGDAALVRAVDILLGLKALGIHAAGTAPHPQR